MAKTDLKVSRSKDGAHVEIALESGGEVVGRAELDAAGAEAHVRQVAEQRAGLAEPVPQGLAVGAPLEGVFDPVWHVQDAPDGVVILALRHPGLGWLSFALPPEEVQPLTEAIRTAAIRKH